MPTFRKELCDSIRPHLKGKKFSPGLVGGLDDILDHAGVPRDDGAAVSVPPAGSTPRFRKQMTDLLRPQLESGRFPAELVKAIDDLLDRAGCPRDADAPVGTPDEPAPPRDGPFAVPPGRLDVAGLRALLGLPRAGEFGDDAKKALLAALSNPRAAALTSADIDRAAADLGVSAKQIKAVRKVEVTASPFDKQGRPTILYERHVFTRNTIPKGRFNRSHPLLSGGPFGKGGFGPISAQYGKLASACALDPEAAFSGCSWGAFQILGEHAVSLGYSSAVAMGFALTEGEAAHLDCFLRFLRVNHLVDKLRACRAGDPASCVPFVSRYNGAGFREFKYHTKLAEALA